MVLKVRSAIGVGMIWLATVAGVSVTAWVAIDRAGRDVTAAAVSSLPPATVSAAVATTTPSRSLRTNASPEPAPSDTSKPATPGPPAATGTAAIPNSASALRDRTLSIAGGQVSVRCSGATIQLRIAQPENGWRVEVEQSGPAKVEVTFARGEDEEGAGTRVTAICSAGHPTFKVGDHS